MLTPQMLLMDEQQQFLSIVLTPSQAQDLTLEHFKRLLKDSTFNAFYLLSDEIKTNLKDLAKRHENDAALCFNVAQRKDATLTLTLSEDHMSVTAVLISAYGGKAVSFEQLLEDLRTLGISQGLLGSVIDHLLTECENGQPGSHHSAEIAKGSPPQHGQDSSFERLVPLARERLLQPKELENGKVDMRDLGSVVAVHLHQPLMRRHPVVQGKEGYTVTGKPLPPYMGKELPFSLGAGVEIDPYDDNLLIASMAGQPIEKNNGMAVEPELKLSEVNVGSGNIEYAGSVTVTGDVSEGMHLKATGNITVGGYVNSAYLEADGDIIVMKGVIGRQKDDLSLACCLQAKGHVVGQFIQYAEIKSGKNVHVERQLTHCLVHCEGDLMVSDPFNRKGDLIGGDIHCGGSITAVHIGSRAGTQTNLTIGSNIEQHKQAYEEGKIKLRNIEEQSLNLRQALNKLPPPDEGNDPLHSLRQQLQTGQQKLAYSHQQQLQKLELLNQEIERYYTQTFVLATETLFPRVKFQIGSAVNQNMQELGATKIINHQGRVRFTPLKA